MFKPRLGMSLDCFGIKWLDDKHYKITFREEELKTKTKAMKEFGFDGAELVTLGPWNRQEEKENYHYVRDAVKIVKDNGLTLNTIHLPFSCQLWNFTSLDEEERKASVESVKWAVSHYENNMPACFVIHPDQRPKTEDERPARLEQLVKSMYEICEFVPANVCVENMTNDGMLNVSSEALKLLEAVPKLNMVIDVNHPLTESPVHYIEQIGSRIKNVHISDRDEVKERHYMPGEGILPWMEIISALDKVGYSGVFNFEVSSKYAPAEVKECYERLFSEYNRG
ncbi:MAG: sugar phosphate isomerase/epimerase [Clostridia bacterium]|nr:sugar phosphate isomerase/epimerase [Clostridia bacterium]